VNSRNEISYRLALSEGFLSEARQDLELGRWRSCVDDAQLSVENAGKAVLSLFKVTPKTHDTAQEIAKLLREGSLAREVNEILLHMLPDLLALGKQEHFLTDYGDEATYTLPWDLFDQDSSQEAMTIAERSLKVAKELVNFIDASQ